MMITKNVIWILKIVGLIFIFFASNTAAVGWVIDIFDKLGAGQMTESVTVTLGSAQQTIQIDSANPRADIKFGCPSGEWPYSLQARMGIIDQQGQLTFVSGQGSGTVTCYRDRYLEIVANKYPTNPISISLQPIKNVYLEPPPESKSSSFSQELSKNLPIAQQMIENVGKQYQQKQNQLAENSFTPSYGGRAPLGIWSVRHGYIRTVYGFNANANYYYERTGPERQEEERGTYIAQGNQLILRPSGKPQRVLQWRIGSDPMSLS